MKKEIVKAGKEILDEIESLEGYKKLLKQQEYSSLVHFEILQHYGDCKYNNEKIIINAKYTQRLLKEVDKIIEELEDQLTIL